MKAIAWKIVLAAFALSLCTAVPAQPAGSGSSAAPDNTKSNADQSNRSPSADQQSNRKSDLEIARTIRRTVLDDKSLSTNAHNAKIVAVNGTVTLNGVVDTADERSTLEQIAAGVVGTDRVVNQVKVKGAQ